MTRPATIGSFYAGVERTRAKQEGAHVSAGRRRRAAGQGHESTLDNESVNPARGPAEPLVRCAVCQACHSARRDACPYCACKEAEAA